jgi:hypothetical protein
MVRMYLLPLGVTGKGPNKSVPSLSNGAPTGILPSGALLDLCGGESGIFQELCKILEIRKTRTSPRNPKCNGQVERFNRTLIGMIKSYLRGEQTNWE